VIAAKWRCGCNGWYRAGTSLKLYLRGLASAITYGSAKAIARISPQPRSVLVQNSSSATWLAQQVAKLKAEQARKKRGSPKSQPSLQHFHSSISTPAFQHQFPKLGVAPE